MAKVQGIVGLVVAFLVVGCVPLAPPPLFARHAGAERDEKGSVTFTVAVGLGLAELSGGFGVEVRARWQTAEDLALGVGFGTAFGDGDPDETIQSTRIYGLRVFGQVNPFDEDHVAATFGVGLSTVNTGMRSLSFDVGALTSVDLGDTVEPSLGLLGAVAIPFTQGEAFGARDAPALPTTTFYYGGNIGLGIHFGSSRNTLSAESGFLLANSISDEHTTAVYFSAADSQGTNP